jgi:hypothetical protein
MKAILVIGWKVTDKAKNLAGPSSLYCGLDGVAASRAINAAQASGQFVGLTCQTVYRSARPLSSSVQPPSAHAKLVLQGELAKQEAIEEAREIEAERIAAEKAKEQPPDVQPEQVPLAGDHRLNREADRKRVLEAEAEAKAKAAAEAKEENARLEAAAKVAASDSANRCYGRSN